MLGKNRFQFESPNAIDAGEAPPCAPPRSRGRRSGGGGGGEGTSAPRSVAVQGTVAKGEHLFRGIKMKIGGSDQDEENPRRLSISTSGSFEGSVLEFYAGDEGSDGEEKNDQLPSPDEARLYAATVLTESFRRLQNDNDREDHYAFAATALANDKAMPLSSSAISGWRRPSRRKSHLAKKNASSLRKNVEFRKTIVCRCFMVAAAAIAVFAVAAIVSTKGGNVTAATISSSSTVSIDETPVNANGETVDSPRFIGTIDWISSHGISDITSLSTVMSPQHQAARWIADTDPMMEEIPVKLDIDANSVQNNLTADELHDAYQRHASYERFLQRYILAVFFFSLKGASWTNDLSFLSGNHECSWFEEEHANDGHKYPVGITCNEKLLVQDIFLPGNNLGGNIPTEIQYLSHLELLSLRHNFVKGSIPSELAHLSTTLGYLDLSKNELSGTIPGKILGKLHRLKVLGVAGNQLTGQIPSELSSLTELLTLDLGHNQRLTGSISAVIGKLTNLRHLYMENNQFEDTMNDSFLENLSHLEELTLNSNKFQSLGELPIHLVSHQNITLLDMSDNFLQGILPYNFLSTSSNTISQLKVLNLQHNQLKGTIPIAVQMLSNLEYFDMSHNALAGGIPVSFGNMKALKELYLGHNKFDSTIFPPSFFTDTNLKVMSLPNTRMKGQIPPWFSMLTSLTYLDLSSNRLTGTIPTELWAMPSLSTLLLRDNMLESILPAVFPQSQLEIVALDNNSGITGSASGICASNPKIVSFSYNCDRVNCTGPCCQSDCCSVSSNSDECFSVVLSASLEAKAEVDYEMYLLDRTFSAFSPTIITGHRDRE